MTVGFEFCYSEKVYFSCADSRGNRCEVAGHPNFTTLDNAIEIANDLIENHDVVEVACCNAETGEVIFIARAHEDECVEEVDHDWQDAHTSWDWYETDYDDWD